MHRAAIAALVAVFPVVADVQSQAVGDKALVHQLVDQAVRHFLDDQPRFFVVVRTGQHLPLADAVRLGAVGVDLLHAARLDTPGVIDQNFRVHPELPVQHIFAVKAGAGQLTHGVDAVLFQPPHRAGAHLPEVGQGLVVPQQIPERFLVQLRDADAVLVGSGVLGSDVHCQLGQVEVGTDPPVAVMPVVYSTSRIMVLARS